jgi:hypothetical protein
MPVSTIPSTSVLSLPAQPTEGPPPPPRRPASQAFANEAYREESERAKYGHQGHQARHADAHPGPDDARVGESRQTPSNVVRFPGGKTAAQDHPAHGPGEPTAGFLAQIIGQEVTPETLDAPAATRRHGEGIAAYEATLARTRTYAGPAYPIHRQI